MTATDLSHANWRKSTRSSGSGENCVEVAFVTELVAVRDSKNPTGPALTFGRQPWQSFLTTAKFGHLVRH